MHLDWLASSTELAPGEKGLLGLRFTIEPGWHMYWLNPGDSGLAPEFEIEIEGGAGLEIGPWHWPAPTRHPHNGLVDLIHEDELLLVAQVRVDPNAIPGARQLEVSAQWLVCQEACEQEDQSATLALEVRAKPTSPTASPAAPSADSARLQKAFDNRPLEAVGWLGRPLPNPPGSPERLQRWSLSAPGQSPRGQQALEFFPLESGRTVLTPGPRLLPVKPGEWSLEFEQNAGFPNTTPLRGLLILDTPGKTNSEPPRRQCLWLTLPIGAGPGQHPLGPSAPDQTRGN